jgi:glycosyltransferase involved in cell wall biosynthesis
MINNDLKKLPVSAVMVIYNEEKVLERALKSFYEVVDEIIIVHDGKCTDKSLEIARKYTDKVFELEHVGESEKYRPFAYEKAQNNWILQLDADEYLSEDLRSDLKNLISSGADIYEAAYTIYGDYYLFYKRVLFRKNSVYLIGVPHESVMPLNEKVKISRLKSKLLHEPLYDNYSLQAFRKKWKSWARAHARSLVGDFRNIPKWNCILSEWDMRRRLLIKHPVVLGMMGATAFKMISFVRLFLKYRKSFIIKVGVFSCMYSFCLYYYVWDFKLRKTEKPFKS